MLTEIIQYFVHTWLVFTSILVRIFLDTYCMVAPQMQSGKGVQVSEGKADSSYDEEAEG